MNPRDGSGLGGFDASHELALTIALVILFVVAAATLVAIWRRVSARVELESAERVIEEDFAALERVTHRMETKVPSEQSRSGP